MKFPDYLLSSSSTIEALQNGENFSTATINTAGPYRRFRRFMIMIMIDGYDYACKIKFRVLEKHLLFTLCTIFALSSALVI